MKIIKKILLWLKTLIVGIFQVISAWLKYLLRFIKEILVLILKFLEVVLKYMLGFLAIACILVLTCWIFIYLIFKATWLAENKNFQELLNITFEEKIKHIHNSFEEDMKYANWPYDDNCLPAPEEDIQTDNAIDETIDFTGKISEIEQGKDGSMVTLVGILQDKGSTIKATLSIPNLGQDSDFDFSDIVVGNNISVKGTTFEMNDMTHLTASYAFKMANN